MGPKDNFADFKSVLCCLFIKSWSSSQQLVAGNRYNGKPISTFPLCYAFHISTELFHWDV
jgi:hypothetical protein